MADNFKNPKSRTLKIIADGMNPHSISLAIQAAGCRTAQNMPVRRKQLPAARGLNRLEAARHRQRSCPGTGQGRRKIKARISADTVCFSLLASPMDRSPLNRPNKPRLNQSAYDLSRQGQNARTGHLNAILRHTVQDGYLPYGREASYCVNI